MGQLTSYAERIQHNTNPNVFINLHSRLNTYSTRIAESLGYLAVVYLPQAIINFKNIDSQNTTVSAYIHNIGVIERLLYAPPTSIKYIITNTSFHIMREIHAVHAALPLKVDRIHVKSH